MKCGWCGYEFTDEDLAPGFDALTGELRCDSCVRKQRHARQHPTFEVVMAEVPNEETW